MSKTYGKKKGEQVFYASRNKGKITGVDKSKKKRVAHNKGKVAYKSYG